MHPTQSGLIQHRREQIQVLPNMKTIHQGIVNADGDGHRHFPILLLYPAKKGPVLPVDGGGSIHLVIDYYVLPGNAVFEGWDSIGSAQGMIFPVP